MQRKNLLFQQIRPAIIAIVSFLILFIATASYTSYKQGQWEKDVRANLLEVLIGKKSKLEKALYSRIYYTRGVAAFVALKPDITNSEFQELASEYIKNDTVINSMALSPNCVIRDIYPMQGHEAAIGLDLLNHPERKEIVEKTIETHQTFVAGPVELVEGGIAFISYTPIFDKTSQNSNQFWGVTDIVIKQNSLFNEAKFIASDEKYRFALRGYNGLGEKGAAFWGDASIFEQKPVTINVDLPIGTWQLAAVPSQGWQHFPNQDKTISTILFISSLIISILIWLFSKALLKIRQNEKELKAIFGSMDNLIVELSREGEYLKIAPTSEYLLYRPKDQLIGKTVHQVFSPEKADFFLDAIRKCLDTKQIVVIDYPLEISGKEHWFTARINYKNSESVIYNAFDVTEKKKDEEIIRQSEIELRELNNMKDRFFSIIAHDLRNPVGSMKTLLDLMLDEYKNMNDEERIQMLESIRLSSTNLYFLLEDLLNWSRSQSGQIIAKKKLIDLHSFCEEQMKMLHPEAGLKNICLKNEVKPELYVFADPDFSSTILRNLISNAVKFTGKGGEVRIDAEEITRETERYFKINVIDTGIGMKAEQLKTIFRIDKAVSKPGTENEKGTGLGLLFCKELAEKQDGELSVTSEPGKGSVFSFTVQAGNIPSNYQLNTC